MLETLADTLPRYRLPAATVAHSRHFMPTGVLEKGREKTTLVFDTWANVGDGALAVRWSCKLDPEAEALFVTLAEHLSYLGRSESWVLAEAVADDAELPPGSDAFPHSERCSIEPGWEQVSLMAPEAPFSYADWRIRSVEKAIEGLPALAEGAKPSVKHQRELAKATAAYPVDLVDCLQKDTAWWKHFRWSQAPGSRRVLYWRSGESLTVGISVPAIPMAASRVTTMLLALTTPSGSLSALPPCRRTLAQAELIHRSLVAKAGGGQRVACPELTGKDSGGTPLIGHKHAHLLPVDLDGDGHLDHVIIYAPMGLGAEAQHAVRRLKVTHARAT
jgi:CRISPR-associated protein Csb2